MKKMHKSLILWLLTHASLLILVSLSSCKPKTDQLDTGLDISSEEAQKKYTYSQSPVVIDDKGSAIVYFGIIPDTPPQPETYRHLTYILIEGEERSVFVDTQLEAFTDWSAFDRIHVVLPPELMQEGQKISNTTELKLTRDENPIPVIVAGYSIVAGIGVAGLFLSRVKAAKVPSSKSAGKAAQIPANKIPSGVDTPTLPTAKPKLPGSTPVVRSTEGAGATAGRAAAPIGGRRSKTQKQASTALTAKAPKSNKTWKEWATENKGKCTALGATVLVAAAVAGCHYYPSSADYLSSTALWVKNSIMPVESVTTAIAKSGDPTLATKHLGDIGYSLPDLPVHQQIDQAAKVVEAQVSSAYGGVAYGVAGGLLAMLVAAKKALPNFGTAKAPIKIPENANPRKVTLESFTGGDANRSLFVDREVKPNNLYSVRPVKEGVGEVSLTPTGKELVPRLKELNEKIVKNNDDTRILEKKIGHLEGRKISESEELAKIQADLDEVVDRTNDITEIQVGNNKVVIEEELGKTPNLQEQDADDYADLWVKKSEKETRIAQLQKQIDVKVEELKIKHGELEQLKKEKSDLLSK